jgi:ATP-dependent DNA helicase PIF1
LIKSKERPLFGHVEDHFWRIEYQARGAPHVHCVLWIKDAPVLGRNTPEEVKAFIERHITCSKPDPVESPTLSNLVSQFQTHKCNKYCTKTYKKKGRFYRKCRFGFPRPTKDEIQLNDITDCLAMAKNNQPRKRLYHLTRTKKESYINDYNAALLLANQANVDVQYIGHLGSRLPYYITDYMTKHERSEQDDMWRDIFSSTKSLGQNAMSFLLKSVSSRQVGANEAADRLLSHKLYSKSRQMRFADLRPADKAKRVLKPLAELNKLIDADPHSDNIYQLHWVIDIYPDRPDSLEVCSLHELLGWYDRDYSVKEHTENLQLKSHNLSLRRRRDTPYIVTHHHVNPRKDNEAMELYFYYLLKLYKPWRTESDLRIDNKTYTETFFLLKDSLPDMATYHEHNSKITEQEIEAEKKIKDRAEQLKKAEDMEDSEDELGALNGCVIDHVKSAMQELMDVHLANVRRMESNNKELTEAYLSLNSDQKRIVDKVVSVVCHHGLQARLLVSGQGGTGKSRVIHVLSQLVSQKFKVQTLPVIVAAPTGLSAFNISASTIHRLLCLPVEHGKPANYHPLNHEQLTTMRATMRDLKLLIIDEISMVSSLTLLYIHLRLTEIMCSHELFGGVSVVFFADLLQLPPVKGNQPFIKVTELEAKQRIGSIGAIDLWQTLSYDELTINMRQKGDEEYAQLLSNARVGYLSEEQFKILSSRLIAHTRRASVAEVIDTYHALVLREQSPLILMPTAALCKEVNDAMLQITGNETVTLMAIDTLDTIVIRQVMSKVEAAYKKTAEDATRSGGLEMKLQLSIGSRVMLKRNKDVDAGLVNGSLGYVTDFTSSKKTNGEVEVNSIQVKFDNICVPITIVRDSSTFEVLKGIFYTRKQFPLMLAFAITIHKSQGLSLKSAVVDAGSHTFGSGMMYVALSRVTSLSGLHLIDLDTSKLKCDRKAILEYNRLRSIYTPHLGTLLTRGKSAAPTDKDTTHRAHAQSGDKSEDDDGKKYNDISSAQEHHDVHQEANNDGITYNVEASCSQQCDSSQSVQFIHASQPVSVFNYCDIVSVSNSFQQVICNRLNLQYVSGELEITPLDELRVSRQLSATINKQTGKSTDVKVHRIIGDGNCLFRALSLAITGTQSQHDLLRTYIVNYMMHTAIRDQMEMMFTARHNTTNASYNTHLARMQNPGTWGTEQEITAAAHLFECSIQCFSKCGPKMSLQHFSPHFVFNPQCNSTCQHQTLYLINSSGSHYNLATVKLSNTLEE